MEERNVKTVATEEPPLKRNPDQDQPAPDQVGPGPIISQPTSYPPSSPRGLEYLSQLDQVLIHQQVELLEVLTNIETPNRYVIKNTLGQQCYYAYEESELCMRICCGPTRGFILHITDNSGAEVARLNREFKCCAGCCWCANADRCSCTIDVESPVGSAIGHIRQQQSYWRPYFEISDQYERSVFQIKGPCCVASGPCCPCDYDFNIITTMEGAVVGKITKQYAGFVKECYTKATNFSVTFPVDLDVKMKASIIAASILIDFMFFEQPKNNNNNR